MNFRHLPIAFATTIALQGCDDEPASPPASRLDAADVSVVDATQDASDAPTVDASRVLIRRTLLPGAIGSMLLDPLVTADTSWGHFYGIIVDGSQLTSSPIERTLFSDTPVGVSAPVVSVGGGAPPGDQPELRLLTYVPGSASPVTASIWVSVSSASGASVPFASRAAGLRVALMANTGLPDSATMQSTAQSLLEPDERTTQERSGRSWVRLSLPSPVAFAQGGYFSIRVTDLSSRWFFTAPEVVIDASTHLGVRRPARAIALDARDRAAMRAYVAHAGDVARSR